MENSNEAKLLNKIVYETKMFPTVIRNNGFRFCNVHGKSQRKPGSYSWYNEVEAKQVKLFVTLDINYHM